MKNTTTAHLKTVWFALLAMLATGMTADALPPMGRHRTGVIENIDHPSQHLTFRADRDEKSRVWAWNNRTRFVRGVGFVSPEAIRKGARVEIIQRSPFFGEPFVTKVVILPNATAGKNR